MSGCSEQQYAYRLDTSGIVMISSLLPGSERRCGMDKKLAVLRGNKGWLAVERDDCFIISEYQLVDYNNLRSPINRA